MQVVTEPVLGGPGEVPLGRARLLPSRGAPGRTGERFASADGCFLPRKNAEGRGKLQVGLGVR